MEFGFKEILFGLAGVSMVAWAGVIGLWHTHMFPRFFKEDSSRINSSSPATSVAQSAPENNGPNKPWFLDDEGGSLTPQTALGAIGLTDRGKYSKKSFVVADFNPVEAGYGVNRVYTSVLILSLIHI